MLIPSFLSKQEKRLVFVFTSLIIFSSFYLLFQLYLHNTSLYPKNGGTYIEGIVGEPKLINPLFSQANDVDQDLTSLLFSGLMKSNGHKLTPDLAEKYTISADQKEYTFQLKPNVYWHDQEPLTTDDIIFTIESIQNKNFKSPLFSSLQGVLATKIDDQNFKLILSEPYTPFLSSLTFGILPAHIWSQIQPENATLAEFNIKSPVGTGPFQASKITKQTDGTIRSYTLIRNENYYQKAPFLEELIFKFYPDYQSGLEALNNKTIDGINFLPQEMLINLNNEQVKIQSLSLPQHTSVFFNQNRNPNLKNNVFREALALAIDKQRIIQSNSQYNWQIISAPILPGYIGYHPNIEKTLFDSELALKKLKQLGWKTLNQAEYLKWKNKAITEKESTESESETSPDQIKSAELNLDKYQLKDNQLLTINLTTTDQPDNLSVAKIIQDSWQKIGVVTNLILIPAHEIEQNVIHKRDYEALLFGEIVGNDPDPYPFWHSSQASPPGLNLANLINKPIDKILEAARQTNDQIERGQLYLKFQDLLVKEKVAIFLYNPTYNYPFSQKIKGFKQRRIMIPADRFNNITDWHLKTKRRLKQKINKLKF